MARKASTQDSEGIIWETAALPLGLAGLDLRRPDAPGVLSELLNARFLDSTTAVRREGHIGRAIQSYSMFTMDKKVLGWVYGHGNQIRIPGAEQWEDMHHPIHTRGGGIFEFGGSDVVWTGDRLFIVTEDGPFLGSSRHWDRSDSPHAEGKGLPAFLPAQTDTVPPLATEVQVDTCLTSTERATVYLVADGLHEVVHAQVINRANGSVVFDGPVTDGDGEVSQLRVLNSGGEPVVIWINTAGLQVSSWNGDHWTSPDVISPTAVTFDADVEGAGFHLVWREGASLFVGKFTEGRAVNAPYQFATPVPTGAPEPFSKVAIAVSPAGELGFSWWATKPGVGTYEVHSTVCDFQMQTVVDPELVLDTELTPSRVSLAMCFRGLQWSNGRHPFVVHASHNHSTGSQVTYTAERIPTDTSSNLRAEDRRFNSEIVTRSFRVGDEIFIWLRATNSSTLFLLGGVKSAQVCGIADREDAHSGQAFPAKGIAADPLRANGTRWTWARVFDTGLDYAKPGNARVGDLDFLPALSAAKFGRSVYIAGSHVRNYDGVELGDAGFHDYTTIRQTASGTDPNGKMESDGAYFYRVYAVRYNNQGERFRSVAVTSAQVLLGPSDNKVALSIKTIPVTNHSNVQLEIYRTANLGITFRRVGSVLNDLSTDFVTFTDLMGDLTLASQPADPHAPTVEGLVELQESGPLGCSVLVTAGDRLWGIGGQVPPGAAQFSKLYEQGEGAGFDALGGTLTLDATGSELTSLAAFSDTTVIGFQQKRLFVVAGAGPNNYGLGAFDPPDLVVADGAISHAGTITGPGWVAFWGAGGPRVIGPNMRVDNICEPVRTLGANMTPSGVQIDPSRLEVVWYSSEGGGLLWNFSGGSRWARWSGLQVAGCSSRALVTTRGRVLKPSASTPRDDGARFEFTLATGNIRPEQVLSGGMKVRQIGITGKYNGEHRAKFKVFYNGSPLWYEKFHWHPASNTWLVAGEDLAAMTPAQIDALGTLDRSGAYATHKRVKRQDCRYFRVQVSDCGDAGFTPWELSVEIGMKTGLGRVPANTFTD